MAIGQDLALADHDFGRWLAGKAMDATMSFTMAGRIRGIIHRVINSLQEMGME